MWLNERKADPALRKTRRLHKGEQVNKKDKQEKFGQQMKDALEENADLVRSARSHFCLSAATVLYGASQIGIIANEFAHNVDNVDPLRQESNDVTEALAELIGEQLQNKSPIAVVNALFWAAAGVAASAVDDCDEDEEEFVGIGVVN
jgi:hypothetical protein